VFLSIQGSSHVDGAEAYCISLIKAHRDLLLPRPLLLPSQPTGGDPPVPYL
jgi:hypothetical protein